MGRFAKEVWKAPVAVNDLGMVSWQNPSYVLDLWGLASSATLEKMREDPVQPGWGGELAERYGADMAMLYADRLDHVIPDDWIVMGELRLDRPWGYVAGPDVTFYATKPEAVAPLREALATFVAEHKPDVVLIGSTAMGKDLGPRLAARLGAACVSDAVGLTWDGGLVVRRPVFAGKCFADVVAESDLVVVGIRPNAFAQEESGGAAETVSFAPGLAAEAAKGVAQASFETDVPLLFGVITAETLEQAFGQHPQRDAANGRGDRLAFAGDRRRYRGILGVDQVDQLERVHPVEVGRARVPLLREQPSHVSHLTLGPLPGH